MRRRIEQHDDQKLAALTGDATGGLAILASDVGHRQPVGKARRHLAGQELGPLGLAHLAARDLAAKIEVDLGRGPERRRTARRRCRAGRKRQQRRDRDQPSRHAS
jgi:hypothetical protein